MTEILPLDSLAQADPKCVGGKAASLGRLLAAGLPVPPGFCLTRGAYRRLQGQIKTDAALVEAVRAAYRQLGGLVAVRSSATAEDSATSSFAGQHTTVLGVQDEDAVLAAIGRCWASLDSDRARAYRRQHGVGDDRGGMAVIVQRLVPSDVAGVLFTRDPLDPAGRRMLVEAAWGLGESVVSGQVMPDRFHLDRDTGQVFEQRVAVKRTLLTPEGLRDVEPARQAQPCLDAAQLAELAALGRRVEELFGDARDVEWAWAEGQFWLLQARPITAGGAAEREQVRQEEIAALRRLAAPGGTVWARYNLAEVLPAPTPMTWAVVREFMSGRGGFGRMYRDLGFDPDPALDSAGIYDLVCGRPYCNLTREPRLQYRWLPLEHSFARLKADPAKALHPQPTLNPARGGWRFYLLLPWLTWKLLRTATRLRWLSRHFADQFRTQIVPAYLRQVAQEEATDWSQRSPGELLEDLQRLRRLVLYDFARDSLKPTVFAALALGNLERALSRAVGPKPVRTALGEQLTGIHLDPAIDLSAGLRALAAGELDRAGFLRAFGHRGPDEMELSQPRWAERPDEIDPLTHTNLRASPPRPEERKLEPNVRAGLEQELQALREYINLRETAKHHLMRGYALIRRVLLELDRRHALNGGVFYLTPDELPRLVAGEEFAELIRQRRRRRTLALSLDVPPVLFSDDLEAVGRPVENLAADVLRGVPLSAGVAEGEALVLHEPGGAVATAGPYILVCPSTDPAWVPLFAQARGLVMEAGGVLSHGAIVARELGLPAVAGLPDVHRRLKTGQRLRVNGTTGEVAVLA